MPLCPIETPGRAGSPAPMTSSPGADRWVRYRSAGAVSDRCGSEASTGRPVAVRPGETAHALLPSDTARGSVTSVLPETLTPCVPSW